MLYLLLLILLNCGLYAQDTLGIEEEKPVVLSEYYYKFYPGDTLNYRFSSRDSIIIDYGKALTKDRYELYEIVCDSVGKKNKYYYLTYSLKNYIADEQFNDMEKIRRTNSPWIDRKVALVIDSTGRRVQSSVDNPTLYAMSPGGAFQPNLLLNFKEVYKVNGESWIVTSTDTLAENGVPYPIMKQSTLFRAQLPIDTLGFATYSANFIKTATGTVTTITNDTKILVEAIISLGGTLYISKKDMIPLAMSATTEQRLKITTPKKEAMPGYQYTSIVYELDSFKPSKFRYKQELPTNSINKKKIKKRK